MQVCDDYNDWDCKWQIAEAQAKDFSQGVLHGSAYFSWWDKFEQFCNDAVDGPEPTMTRQTADIYIDTMRKQIASGGKIYNRSLKGMFVAQGCRSVEFLFKLYPPGVSYCPENAP